MRTLIRGLLRTLGIAALNRWAERPTHRGDLDLTIKVPGRNDIHLKVDDLWLGKLGLLNNLNTKIGDRLELRIVKRDS